MRKTTSKKTTAKKAAAKSKVTAKTRSKKVPKVLIAYYTRSNTTMRVAHDIGLRIGGDLKQIRDINSRTGVLGWILAGKDAAFKNETKIHFSVSDLSKYDYILLGTPTWASNITPAVRTFINEAEKIEGIKFGLFSTCLGGPGNSLNEMSELLKKKKAKIFAKESFVMSSKKSHSEIRDEIVKFADSIQKKIK